MSQQHDSVDAISNDIEQTRQQMRTTIDMLQDRLSPQHLIQDARDSVLGVARERSSQALHTSQAAIEGAGSAISDAITQNPVLGAALGISLGWLANIGRTGDRTMDDQTQQQLIMARERVQDAADQFSSQAQQVGAQVATQAQQMAGQAQQVGSQLAAQAQQAGAQVASQAQQVGTQVAAQAQQAGAQVAAQAQQAGNWLQHTLEDNALLIGAAAVVVGFAIGVALPQSTQENQLMGGTRDHLLHQAQSTAQDTIHKVQSAAHDALQVPPANTTNVPLPNAPQSNLPPPYSAQTNTPQ